MARPTAQTQDSMTSPPEPIRKQTALWTTKEGQRIRLCDMTDSHLLNTVKFLERVVHGREVSEALALANSVHGEMATLHAEQVLDDALENGEGHDCAMPPIYEQMVREAIRRGLDV